MHAALILFLVITCVVGCAPFAGTPKEFYDPNDIRAGIVHENKPFIFGGV
jgi:hypothetical protein